MDSKQRIFFFFGGGGGGGSSAVYGVLLLGQGCCSFSQYNLQGRMLDYNVMRYQTRLHIWNYRFTLANILYSVRVQYLLSIHSWDSRP